MIKSMTGFGRGEYIKDGKKFLVEIKTVNHRYLDINIKIQKKFNFLEQQIKSLMKSYVNRGKVDVYISYEDNSESSNSVKVNLPLAKDYVSNLTQLSKECKIENDMTVTFLSKLPDVIKLEEQDIDEELLWNVLSTAIINAADNLLTMRKKEGELLYNDLLLKLNSLEDLTSRLEVRCPQVIIEYQNKLNERLSEILNTDAIDENRIAQEVALLADRCGIDEEIVRLKSHITQMKDTIKSMDSVGRKLDFLAQEMNREANTIASKSNDIEITKLAIELKTEIEKIREQIQNIE